VLQGGNDKTIQLTLICADGAVMVGIRAWLIHGNYVFY
jgi:hypothetical protein